MLKIRLQGTIKDIEYFRHFLERSSDVELLDMSEPFSNKGTSKYFRVYGQIEIDNNNSYTENIGGVGYDKL